MVEIIIDNDRKEITSGEKANRLLRRANGLFIVFIDDDDEIYRNYISSIIKKIIQNKDVDCIATTGHYSVDGGEKTLWKLSKDFADEDKFEDGKKILYRRANHLTPVRREHALAAMFPHVSKAEDKEYSRRINPYLKTEVSINDPIYHYKYSSHDKEY